MTTDAKTGSSFNRYAYANNSPYQYGDPDGRNGVLAACFGGPLACGVAVIATFVTYKIVAGPVVKSPFIQNQSDAGSSSDDSAGGGTNSEAGTPGAPVDGATGGERVGKGPRIWNKPPSDDPVGDANSVFYTKFPNGENVADKGDGVRVGTLPDGKRVIVRPESSDGSGNVPTIEIQNSAGSNSLDKIRYPRS